MRTILLSLVVVWAACSADAPAGARFDPEVPRRTIDGGPECPNCEIVLHQVARLGHSSDPTSIAEGALTVPCAVGRLGDGRYAVGGVVDGGRVLVYDEGGRAVGAIGREGEGPGEFGSDLRVLVGAGDTMIHVVDNSNLRVTSVTAAGEVVGSFRTPGRVQSQATLRDARFLLHARPLGTPADERSLFRLLDRSGTELARFGEPSDALADLDQWIVSPARPDGFWTASLWSYELYRWSGADSLLWTLVREDTPWFPREQDLSAERFENIYESVPPPASMWHVHEAEDGRLWVYAWVPDEAWEPGPIRTPPPEWTREKLDTMIEVIDPTGDPRVVARRRYDRLLSPVCGSDLMFTVVYAESGDTRAVVLRPELDGPNQV